MMKFAKIVGSGLLCFLILTISSCKKNEFLPESIVRTNLASSYTKKEYKLYISLPEGYSKDQEYPVIFHLDGDKDFKKIARASTELMKEGKIPTSLVVGIGYGDYTNSSENDYLPTSTQGAPEGGGAMLFFQFLSQELPLFLSKEYGGQTSNNTLIGNNFGGLFSTLTILLSNSPTKPFNKFVIVSPAINYDDGIAFSWEQEKSLTWTDINASVIFLIGSNDAGDRIMMCNAFNKKIGSRNYPSFRSSFQVLKNTSKELIIEEAAFEGLEFVFNN